ncbi:SAM-dependent methyltransferase, partial [Streptomyces sp. SID8382]|nr:SAM-dependent methyltransferase [Streptomyces sp. SID8382]
MVQEHEPGTPGEDTEPMATRRTADEAESSRASRGWWDRNADEYQEEHGAFLGDDRFIWGPEGLDEAEAGLLGPVEALKGRDVLEVGAGAAQCARWLAAQGARPVALDLSHRQLRHARRID